MKLEFSQQSVGKTQIQNFVKIRPVGAELFHADGQKDRQTETKMTKLGSVVRSFAKRAYK